MALCCFAIFASGMLLSAVLFATSSQKNTIDSARWEFASSESARFIEEQMPGVQQFTDRFALLKYALSQITLQSGLTAEFGVFRGESINYIASVLPGRAIHGFDSFEGNPEDSKDFLNWKKGTFDLGGKLPKVRANVTLHKGWFDKSVPEFARQNPGPMAFMHMDADLYSSTKTVFDTLADRILPGTVIVFDEFFNYPGWKRGESKAFAEMIAARNLKFEYLGYADQQVAVKIR